VLHVGPPFNGARNILVLKIFAGPVISLIGSVGLPNPYRHDCRRANRLVAIGAAQSRCAPEKFGRRISAQPVRDFNLRRQTCVEWQNVREMPLAKEAKRIDELEIWAWSASMIIIVSGTNRPGNCTRIVAAGIGAIYHLLGIEYQLLDLEEMPLETFSPQSYSEKPHGFKKFADAILASDGLVIVTPEYNGGMPGVLKYFIDMLPFPESFENRPVCFVGLAAGIWGALRPVEQLQAIFGYRNAYVFPVRVFIPGVDRLISESGHLQAPEIETRLKRQAAAFVDFVERLRGKKLRQTAG
jgi:chromate reductase, NAD(P)H dehydrogenase (quinone)